jgi:hypothetical protein
MHPKPPRREASFHWVPAPLSISSARPSHLIRRIAQLAESQLTLKQLSVDRNIDFSARSAGGKSTSCQLIDNEKLTHAKWSTTAPKKSSPVARTYRLLADKYIDAVVEANSSFKLAIGKVDERDPGSWATQIGKSSLCRFPASSKCDRYGFR